MQECKDINISQTYRWKGKCLKMHRPPLVVHPSTISQSFAGYPEIQNWTFINNIWINKSVRTTIRASHHFKCQRLDCKSDIVAEGTQWVKGTTLMRCLWRLSWCNNFKVVSTPIKILQSVRSLIFSQLSKLLFVSCIWMEPS